MLSAMRYDEHLTRRINPRAGASQHSVSIEGRSSSESVRHGLPDPAVETDQRSRVDNHSARFIACGFVPKNVAVTRAILTLPIPTHLATNARPVFPQLLLLRQA